MHQVVPLLPLVPVAMGLFAGVAHVLIDGDPTFRARVPAWAFGLPVREAFPAWGKVHDVMDRVLATGRPATVDVETAELLLVRVPAVAGQPGVAVHARLRMPLSPPPVHEPPAPLPEVLAAH